MIRDRVYMGNARHNNFVTSAVTAKTVRDKGADTDPCVAAEKFLVDHDGSPKTRLTEVLAVLVRIVIVHGKSVQYLFLQPDGRERPLLRHRRGDGGPRRPA